MKVTTPNTSKREKKSTHTRAKHNNTHKIADLESTHTHTRMTNIAQNKAQISLDWNRGVEQEYENYH
jgi:hypothetical protein